MKIILFNKKSDSSIIFRGFFGTGFLRLQVVFLFLLVVAYVFQVSQMTKETYAIQTHSTAIMKAMAENRNNEYNFLQANSLSRAKAIIEEMGFERINDIHHIKITKTEVAVIR